MTRDNEHKLFAGLDVSTQGCKLVVIDFDKKKVIFTDSINYDRDLPQYNTENGRIKTDKIGVSESDPNMWTDAIDMIFGRLKAAFEGSIKGVNEDNHSDKWEHYKVSDIKAISVSGQQHGLVTLKKDGRLSRPYSKLWNDFSTSEECEIITERVGGVKEMIKEIGNTQRTGYTAPKILNMVRFERENYDNTAHILLVHNFINWYLTYNRDKKSGAIAMEPGDVSGTALWDPIRRDWSLKVINAIDPDLIKKLPEVKPSREAIGKIGTKFIEEFGFSQDCIVAGGSGDNMMGAIGTGNVEEGILTVSLGTSGTAYCFMKKPFVDESGEIALFCDATGNYLPLLCISNMANGYEWALRRYKLTHEEFEELVGKSPVGNGGRVLCPWYEGERTPDLPDAFPVLFGWNFDDFTPENICRGIVEGHVLNLYEGYLKLPIKTRQIRLTGGMAKSRLWRKTIANIFNCEVIPVLGEGAALGAALLAAWSYYKDKSIKEIIDGFIVLDYNSLEKPDPDLVKRYDLLKQIYLNVSKRIRGKGKIIGTELDGKNVASVHERQKEKKEKDVEDPFKLLKKYREVYST
ncbi:MAG: xylulokinase [Promethearchaeota archaeon]